MIIITESKIEYAHQLGEIQIDAWLHNYPNPTVGITAEDIKAKTDEWRAMGDIRIVNKLHEEGTQTWVAKENDEIVGFIGIKNNDKTTLIEALFVSPKHQRKGIGSMLLKYALSCINEAQKISLEVLFHNENAIRFYKSFGFIEQGENDNPLTLPSGKIIPSILMTKV